MKIKPGASLLNLNHGLVQALDMLDFLFISWEQELVVTSGTDGIHSERSWHYAGRAIDIRTRNFPNVSLGLATSAIQGALGSDFHVKLENLDGANEHWHISYPERGKMAPLMKDRVPYLKES